MTSIYAKINSEFNNFRCSTLVEIMKFVVINDQAMLFYHNCQKKNLKSIVVKDNRKVKLTKNFKTLNAPHWLSPLIM